MLTNKCTLRHFTFVHYLENRADLKVDFLYVKYSDEKGVKVDFKFTYAKFVGKGGKLHKYTYDVHIVTRFKNLSSYK